MKLINLKCPNCGSNLEAPDNVQRIRCAFCNANFLLDDGVKRYRMEDAEHTGYLLEKGRQRALAEYNQAKKEQAQQANKQSQYYYYQEPEPKKRRTWLWVLG